MKKGSEKTSTLPFGREGKLDGPDGDPTSPGIAANRDEDDVKGSRAQQIVKELYERYEKQLQRWHDYRTLFMFLGVVGLYLGVLYLQRGAHDSYQVHSTIVSVVVPTQNIIQSQDQVLKWLQGLLKSVWVDPICGDGLCEVPWEFASYGRFGCRADCRKLSDIQNLTKLQIDLYYNFDHPLGSLPAADLMQQASWNLCPVQTAYSSSCYYQKDVTFDTMNGEQHVEVVDAPDGTWDLVIKLDTFSKVQGAVRSVSQLQQAAFYVKTEIALLAAMAEQDYEIDLLQEGVSVASTRLFQWVSQQWTADNASKDGVDMSRLINASCVCPNGTVPLQGTQDFDASTYSASAPCTGAVLLERTCVDSGNAVVPYGTANATCTIAAPANTTAACESALSELQGWRNNLTATVQSLLYDERLGDQQTTGKVTARTLVRNGLLRALQWNNPELVGPVFSSASGTDPFGDPANCSIDALMQGYVNGPTYALTTAPASAALSQRNVYGSNVTLSWMVSAAMARVTEVRAQRQEVLALTVKDNMAASTTLAVLNNRFTAAGANDTFLPDPSVPALAPFNVSYNLASWQGNTTAYMVCDLDSRSPPSLNYTGVCVDMPVSCSASANDTAPYSCIDRATNASLVGGLADVAYRQACELPCDRQVDCDTVCECYGACGANQRCECAACLTLSGDATLDKEFQSLVALKPTETAQAIAALPASRRRLLQSNTTDLSTALDAVLDKVNSVKAQQAALAAQMVTLQDQIAASNKLEAVRAADTTLTDTITATRTSMQAGQTKVNTALDQVLNRQEQALATAQAASTAISNVRGLAGRQEMALQALDRSVQTTLLAVASALSSSAITPTQALLLWKRTRRQRAFDVRARWLANVPCNANPTAANTFTLDNGMNATVNAARERSIGLTNRVISGMLLHTWRSQPVPCRPSKFDKIQPLCLGGSNVEPYGVDPVFKLGTESYNPSLNDAAGLLVTGFHNCSKLSNVTYDVVDEELGLVTNPKPYCSQLYSPQSLPYAFHHVPLLDLPLGFPIWFDINLSAEDAQTWFTWLSEALLLDTYTTGLSADILTYNAKLRIFAAARVEFQFNQGGSIVMRYRVYTLRVELYRTATDKMRLAAEIILTVLICSAVARHIWSAVLAQIRLGSALKYLGPYTVDVVSDLMLLVAMSLWWVIVNQYALPFRIKLRYDVYPTLQPQANFLDMGQAGPAGLTEGWGAFVRLNRLINLLNWYYALNGFTILVLIFRNLKLMDFQPRLGVVTRSLSVAAQDLVHFAIVFGMVFVGYAMMGHLIFGNSINAFSTFGSAVNTCFEILLGNIAVNNELRALAGLQNFAGTLFFWSYELLVYMVLLNFLLAIIVDAFSEVKEKTSETTGMHTELLQIAMERFRAVAGRLNRTYISDDKLRELLRQWAGEDEPGAPQRGVVEEAGKEKTIRVAGEEVDEDALKEVLRTCLADARATVQHERESGRDEAPVKGGALWRLWARVSGLAKQKDEERKAAQQVMDMADKDIDVAAKYVINRFGGGSGALLLDTDEAEEVMGHHGHRGRSGADRDQLGAALERLADVQRELAEGQRSLTQGQKQLAEQQARLVSLMNSEAQASPRAPPPGGNA